MQTRGNHPDYHLLHNGYQAGAPSEDWISSLSENPLAEHDDLDHDHKFFNHSNEYILLLTTPKS